MSRLSYYIRSNPSWWLHLNDPTYLATWQNVGLTDGYLRSREMDIFEDSDDLYVLMNAPPLTERQIRWVLSELSSYAAQIDHVIGGQPSCFERIWESDTLMDPRFTQQLCKEIEKRFLSNEKVRNTCIRQLKSPDEETR
ncbi:hypothetical protein FRC17_004422, partial [Serendipita sp. 399]